MDWKKKYCSNVDTPQSNLQPQCSPYQVTLAFSTELEQTILKYVWNQRRPRTVQVMLKKKSKHGSITIPDLKLCYKAIITKRVWYWHEHRDIHEWNRIENPEMDSQVYSQVIFDKRGKNIQWKKTVSSANGIGKTG